MKLIQYWDQAKPPGEVSEWIDGFRANNPELEHVLFNEATAARFIAEHQGERALRAFQACAVPAMQADFFRLCAIEGVGGLYVDADCQCLQPLGPFLDSAPGSMMFVFFYVLNNAFMFFRTPGDPFIRACLEVALDNIERRRFDQVFSTTGPLVYNAVRLLLDPSCAHGVRGQFENSGRLGDFDRLFDRVTEMVEPTAELAASFQNLKIVNIFTTETWIGSQAPEYKNTDRHWLHWKGDIYRP